MDRKSIYEESYYKDYSQDLIARKNLIDAISKNLDFEGKTGLDAGCNGGFLSFHLTEDGAKMVYGCDISPQFISQNKKKAKKLGLNEKTDFKVADVQKLPYKDSCFDFVVCSEVIEHIKEPEEAVNEFYRVLKKGGVLILTTPNILNPAEILHNLKHYLMWFFKKEEITHVQHFTLPTIKKYFIGYKKVGVQGLGFGAAFLPNKYFFFLRSFDLFLGKLLPLFAFDILVVAEK